MDKKQQETVLPLDTIMRYLMSISGRYSRRFHGRYPTHEIANEVWCLGRIQKSTDTKRLCVRIHWDVKEVLREFSGGRYRTEIKDSISNPVHYDQLEFDDGKKTEMLASEDLSFLEVDRTDWFEDITRGCVEREKFVLELKFLQNYSQVDIARKTSLSEGRISQLIMSGLLKIRRRFALMDESYEECLTFI